MDPRRAKEIAESPEMVSVKYNGKQIYIQNVNEAEETARIYTLDDPENEKDVPLNTLNETR